MRNSVFKTSRMRLLINHLHRSDTFDAKQPLNIARCFKSKSGIGTISIYQNKITIPLPYYMYQIRFSHDNHARIQRGGGTGGPDPPLEFENFT